MIETNSLLPWLTRPTWLQADKKAEPEIFVGYSSTSKAYRIYLPQSNKVIVSRDVKFLESDSWDWKNDKRSEFQEENEDVDEEPIRGTRSLSDIYQRCNVAVMEPEGYEEAATDQKWINAMKEELIMIEKIKHGSWWTNLTTRKRLVSSGFIEPSSIRMVL